MLDQKIISLYISITLLVICLVISIESKENATNDNEDKKLPFAIKWVKMDLDNFNPSNTKTWFMRYSEDDKYYDGKGPIFLMIGGEWAFEDSPDFFNMGMMPILAKEHNGLMVYPEHRYYGKSYPTSNWTLENLKYLSFDQALADLAHFIDFIKTSKNISSETPVIAYGCSYAGGLAAWMKIKYPHLILGAISSSGQAEVKVENPDYLDHVEKVLKEYNSTCFENCQKALLEAREYLYRPDGRTELEKFLSPDQLPTDFSNEDEKTHFLSTLSSPMRKVVHLNTRWSESYSDIKIFCNLMNNEKKHASPLKRLLSYEPGQFGEFMEKNYLQHINELKNENITASLVGRKWQYQVCTNIGVFFTNSDPNGLFGVKDALPTELSEKYCKETFGPSYDLARVRKGVKKTNLFYGGKKPEVRNVIYVNGDKDPWHSLSILEDLNESVHSVIIKGGSHSEDLLTPVDNPELLEAKEKIRKIVAGWLAPRAKKSTAERKDEL